MKTRRIVNPKYVITITAILAGLMVLTGFLVIRRASSNMLRVMKREGIALTESLIESSKNMLKAGSIIEPIFLKKLLDQASFVAKLDQTEALSRESLTDIAIENDLSRIDIFDGAGRLIRSSLPHVPTEEEMGLLEPIFDGTVSELPLGIVGEDFGVAVRREKGAVACYIDASYIKNFKKEMGIGSLIQAINEKGGVEYIVLQNRDGIVFASQNVEEMKKLDKDPFLKNALLKGIADSRVCEFGAHKVFEVVKPFFLGDEPFGIFRVGLPLTDYNQIVRENQRHVIVLVGIIFLIGAIVFGFVIVNQNYAILDKSYNEIKTLTGSVLESMGSAVVAIDAGEKITMLNRSAERLFSISRSNAIGKDYMSVFSNDECLIDETLEKGRITEDIVRTYKTLSGEHLTISISTSSLFDKDGKIGGAVAVIRDVTKMKRMEEAMRQKERLSALGDLAAGVAHEIRNPLNAIALTSQRLKEEFVPKEKPEEFRSFIRGMRNEAARLNGIVEQFLSLARPMKLDLAQVDINALIDELLTLIESEARRKEVTIKKRLVGATHELPLLVEIDRDEIKKAILNIIRNGIEAMEPGGELFITTEMRDEECKVMVVDTGCGIAKKDIPKIFRPYFSRKGKGTGLGLSITHRIITEHKGNIEVESTEGVGTAFTITLPLRQ